MSSGFQVPRRPPCKEPSGSPPPQAPTASWLVWAHSSLLAEVAEERPLVCLVDDAQWLDQPSTDALLRRPTARGRRDRAAGRRPRRRLHAFTAPSFGELHLTGLDADAAGALLTEQFRSRARAGRSWAPDRGRPGQSTGAARAAGVAECRPARRAGAASRPVAGQHRVERVFLERVRRLPESAQTMLLAAAAEEAGDPAVIVGAGRALGSAWRRSGWPRRPGWRVSPRAASSSPSAGALGGVPGATSASARPSTRRWRRHWWARSMPTVAPGTGRPRPWSPTRGRRRAGTLAERARRSSGYAAAARALERSAELTLAEELRSRRLVDRLLHC